eukprot:5436755-Prymnesium_polylepis.1
MADPVNATPPAIARLSDFVEAFRNASHPYHAHVQRSYLSSAWLPRPRFYNLLVSEGDPFLISQRDYLRGVDCSHQRLHLLCTERLEAEYDSLLSSYGVPVDDYKRVPGSRSNTPLEHIVKRVSRSSDSESPLQKMSELGETDRRYVREQMYPWDVQLHELACRTHGNEAAGLT